MDLKIFGQIWKYEIGYFWPFLQVYFNKSLLSFGILWFSQANQVDDMNYVAFTNGASF